MAKFIDFRRKALNSAETPTKKTLLYFTVVYLFGMTCLVLAKTDLFTQNFFEDRSPILYLLVLISTIHIAQVYRNYYRNRS